MGRNKIGDALDVEALVERYIADCMHLGEMPTVKGAAGLIGITPVTLYRRYLEATGEVLSEVLRTRHSRHLHVMTAHCNGLEQLAERTGYSCGRSVRRRLKALSVDVGDFASA